MRVVWLTDIHLNFLSPVGIEKFYSLVRGSEPDVILISGDISEATRLEWHLQRMDAYFQRPIYFVLGNHDYYGSSFGGVAAIMTRLSGELDRLHWLTAGGVVELADGMALVGCDSWSDGRYGDYA